MTPQELFLAIDCVSRRFEELKREQRYGGYAQSYMESLPGQIAELDALLTKLLGIKKEADETR